MVDRAAEETEIISKLEGKVLIQFIQEYRRGCRLIPGYKVARRWIRGSSDMKARFIVAALIGLLCLYGIAAAQEGLTAEEKGWVAKASRTEENGWIHVMIGGAPFERGFQHG